MLNSIENFKHSAHQKTIKHKLRHILKKINDWTFQYFQGHERQDLSRKLSQIGEEMKTKCIWYPGLDSEPEKGHSGKTRKIYSL